MLPYLFAATLLGALAPPEAPSLQSSSERIGVWDVRMRVDPVTDYVSIGAYMGTLQDNFAIVCGPGNPRTVRVVWRSRTRFREGRSIPLRPNGPSAYGAYVGYTAYRFDQDEAVTVPTGIDASFNSYFFGDDIDQITRRIATSTRFVLRDDLNLSHTVIFDLEPADTLRVLQRLDAVCGTSFSSPQAEPAAQPPEGERLNKAD